MKKRILVLIICSCLLMSTTACLRADGDTDNGVTAQEDTAEPIPAQEDQTEPVPAQEDTTEPVPAQEDDTQPDPAQTEDLPERYLELVADKAELAGLVQERVAVYKNGGESELGSGHMAYPADYPSASGLPDSISASDFVIRCNENLDPLEAIYAAVPIGEGYELRMAFDRRDMDGVISWNPAWTWFAHVDDVPWMVQDINIYQ